MKKVLITGVSSGIGEKTKDAFLTNGYYVIGLDIKDALDTDNFKFIKTDITSETDVLNVSNYLTSNKIELDAIINIAGIHKMASLVEDDYNKLKKVIDINLLGPMLINNKLHKYLKPKGKIVIITSEVAGYDPLPFNGLYSISKIALENYAQALRQKLNLLNQNVITIMPGAIETPLQGGSIQDTSNLSESTILYKEQSKKFLKITKKFMGKPLKPEKLAKKIYKITVKKRNKLTYKVHRSLGLVLLNLLPKRLQCAIIKWIL